jgi:hypothetical protein
MLRLQVKSRGILRRLEASDLVVPTAAIVPEAEFTELFGQVASAFDGGSLGELDVKGKGVISVFGLRTHKK